MKNRFLKIVMIAAIASLSQVDMSTSACADKPTLDACHSHCSGAAFANVPECTKNNCIDCPGFNARTFCGYIGDPSDNCINSYKKYEPDTPEAAEQRRILERESRESKEFGEYLLKGNGED